MNFQRPFGRIGSTVYSELSRTSWTTGTRFCAGSVWISPAGSDAVCRSDDISPYWIGQAILGFTNSHKFGFTKVSDGEKKIDFSLESANLQNAPSRFKGCSFNFNLTAIINGRIVPVLIDRCSRKDSRSVISTLAAH